MSNHVENQTASLRALTDDELDIVTGGVKWHPVDNPDVVDARGGQIKFLGLTISFGADGKISDIS